MKPFIWPGSSLIENFNTTNQSSPQYAAHDSYVTNPKFQVCSLVHDMPYEGKCLFVMKNENCHGNEQFIDYSYFLFCLMNSPLKVTYYIGVLLLILECVYMFTILGTTADTFFCPALAVLASAMGLSENLAGVTLLAFGNGSPDVFTALSEWDNDTELFYSELFGAAMFIIGCVGAVIMIIRPFSVSRYSFLRDVFFFLLACSIIYASFHSASFNYFKAIGVLMVYLVYLTILIIEHFKTQHQVTGNNNWQESAPNDGNPNKNLFQQFCSSLNPIDLDEWRESGRFGKCLCITKVPIMLGLTVFIPVVDYTLDNHGWSKLLNVLHIITLPIAVCLLKGYFLKTFWYVPVPVYCIVCSIPLCLIVFFTSRTDRPPKYHLAFAIFGSFIGSIVFISTFASEVVSVLTTLGIVSNLSNSMLGLSALAWGNSIGDLMSNIALARQGYTTMGFSACFGGPMFNTIFSMSIVFLMKLRHSTESVVYAREGSMGPNCGIFLLMLLSFTGLIFILTGYQARRSTGFFMIAIYCLFVLYAFLGEYELIHTYGTDHRNEGDFEE